MNKILALESTFIVSYKRAYEQTINKLWQQKGNVLVNIHDIFHSTYFLTKIIQGPNPFLKTVALK